MPGTLVVIKVIYGNQFKYIYLKNQTIFLDILLHFLEPTENFKLFHKKYLNLIVEVFFQLLTLKIVVTQMDSRSSFRTPFCSQRFNGSPTLQKSARERALFSNFIIILT